MARKRKKEFPIESLFSMPWWVSGLLAGAAFFSPNILQSVLPEGAGQMGLAIKQGLVTTAENLSPYLATGLFIIALIILAKDTYKKRKFTPVKISQNRASPRQKTEPKGQEYQPDSAIADILADRVYAKEPEAIVPTSWSLDVLQSIEWKRYEELCEALFNELNLIARNTKFGADGGIDIELYAKNAPDTLVAIAQCKAWSNPVGVAQIRAFYGVMAARSIKKGYFITTSSFTDDARMFGEADGLSLINGNTTLKLIGAMTKEQSDKLLKLATKGDYTTPTCPSCGLKMLSRTASKSGTQFWGCRNYPRCKGKLNMKNSGKS